MRLHIRMFSERADESLQVRLRPASELTLPKSPHSDNLILPDEPTRLDLPEFLVEIALVREQFFVRPGEDDGAFLYHDETVHMHHGREPMRDGDDRLPLHQPQERVLDEAFRFGIEARGRFIEYEDGRVFEYGAGNGDPLALAARELHAALAHECIEPFRVLADELVAVRLLRRFDDLVVGRILPAVADVVEE